MNPRDALVKVLNDNRIAFNADALMQALDALGFAIAAKEPTALDLGAAVRASGQQGD